MKPTIYVRRQVCFAAHEGAASDESTRSRRNDAEISTLYNNVVIEQSIDDASPFHRDAPRVESLKAAEKQKMSYQ